MNNTEKRNPKTMHIDKMSTIEMLKIINEEDASVIKAVEKETEKIAEAVDNVAKAFENGGRLFYIGAGTSGRLGVMDAAECPPTFGVSNDLVHAIIAGGEKTMTRASENEEDNREKGIEDLMRYGLTSADAVVGISASGGAPYVLGAIEAAKKVGCITIGISNNKGCQLDKAADISVCVETGPEVVTGSTRMKAGTSQKLILNMISTCAMIKTGKVYENLMINLRPTNVKLKKRVISIVRELTNCTEAEAQAELKKNDWDIRKTVDSYKNKGASYERH